MCWLPVLQPNVTAFDGQHSFGLGAVAAAAASAAAGAGPVPWLPSGLFSGDGTAFSEAVPNTGKGFACSYRYLNDWASTHFAAINRPMVRGRGQAGAPGWSRRCGVGQERAATTARMRG